MFVLECSPIFMLNVPPVAFIDHYINKLGFTMNFARNNKYGTTP
jgi:hypothetical protein